MANLLDLFAIGFSSEGLKEFETNLKNTERELDKAEKEVTRLEKKLADLEKAENKDEKAIRAVKVALQEANDKVKMFGDELKTMQGKSEYQLVKLKQNFGNLTKTLGMLAAVGVAVKKSLDFYEQAEQLDFLAQKSGIAAEKLQALGNASKRYGGTTEGAAGTVENLRSQYQSLRMGQGGGGLEQAAFKYGVAISSDPEKMLENVARRMETLKSDAAKWDLAKTLGIDEGTTRLLMQGVEGYRKELERANKYKLYTKEDIARMREFRQLQLDIRLGLENIFGTIWRSLLPVMMRVGRVIRGTIDWFAGHEGATKIIALLAAISAGVLAITTSVKLLSGALALLKTVNPEIAAIVFSLTALAAALNDIIVYIQGGESVTGHVVDQVLDGLDAIDDRTDGLITKIKSKWDELPEPLKRAFGVVQGPLVQGATLVQAAKEYNEKISKGQQVITQYNNHKLNGVPASAIANYNQAQHLSDINNNTKNINNLHTTNRNINVQEIKVVTQATNGQEIWDGLTRCYANIDNGIR